MYTKPPEGAKPEIKATTCGQYALIRPQVAGQTVGDLTAGVDGPNSKIAEPEAARDSGTAQFTRNKGRGVIAHRARGRAPEGESITRGGQVKTFADRVSDHIDKYPTPHFMAEDEFIFVSGPGSKSIYIDLADEARVETNND